MPKWFWHWYWHTSDNPKKPIQNYMATLAAARAPGFTQPFHMPSPSHSRSGGMAFSRTILATRWSFWTTSTSWLSSKEALRWSWLLYFDNRLRRRWRNPADHWLMSWAASSASSASSSDGKYFWTICGPLLLYAVGLDLVHYCTLSLSDLWVTRQECKVGTPYMRV